jgi:hypothetical protein
MVSRKVAKAQRIRMPFAKKYTKITKEEQSFLGTRLEALRVLSALRGSIHPLFAP